MKALLLTLFLSVSFGVTAQIDSYHKEIVDLLNINGMREDCSMAYYEVFPKLKRNFEKKDIPESAWQDLKKDEDKQVDDALKDVAFAYRKHFTQEEIGQMMEFYITDAAQNTLAGKELSKEEEKELKAYLKSDVGKKMKKVNGDLNKDIDKILDQWKRELFGIKMKELIKGGYL